MSKRGRLDQFIAKRLQISKKAVKQLMLQGQVSVDNELVTAPDHQIDEFSHIQCQGEVLQNHQPQYYLLHKPRGVVSATKDKLHPTALALLSDDIQAQSMLHIAGRLDLNSTGVLLITNDAKWSAALMAPEHKLIKQYLVTLANPITQDYIQAFEAGMYFEYEDATTLPAKLEIQSSHQAIVYLQEGKYHQIKRMFGRFRNPVLELHRFAIGDIELGDLPLGQWRALTSSEVDSVWQHHQHHQE